MKRSLRPFFSTLSLLLFVEVALPQEYIVDTLATSRWVTSPTSIAFTPDGSGRFFFGERTTGRVRIFEKEGTKPTIFTTVSVATGGDQGLLGVAVHPLYPDTPYVYVFYTRSGDRANIVVRYRDSSGIGIDPRNLLFIQRLNTGFSNNGGRIHFGPDSKLYIATGDFDAPANSQDLTPTNLRGKILRLSSDGTVPRDNPFDGTAFWSAGHRNTLDFTWDSKTGYMFCTDNGSSCNDEINLVVRGSNLGWPVDGNCLYSASASYVKPIFNVPNPPLPGVSGLVVYRGKAFPHLNGKLLFVGTSSTAIWSLTLEAAGDSVVPGSLTPLFKHGMGFVDIKVGPDGNIYLAGGNKILRMRPAPPRFESTPPLQATQDIQYTYQPSVQGAPSIISLFSGPDGVEMDESFTVSWTPTNDQALKGSHQITLRAENGGGFTDQTFTVSVANVNDPPGPFELLSPSNDTTLFLSVKDPALSFTWQRSVDPDLDTVRYILQIDTSKTFGSRYRYYTPARTQTSREIIMPRGTKDFYWRVLATDGQDTIASTDIRRVRITFPIDATEAKHAQSEAALEQNFPNPFNPATTISFTIPNGGHVRLAVFNLLGQEVALIYEGEQSAGTHEVKFNSAELPSGIYFYRIQAPGFVQTRKMIITK